MMAIERNTVSLKRASWRQYFRALESLSFAKSQLRYQSLINWEAAAS
jgi:hypothetical protein